MKSKKQENLREIRGKVKAIIDKEVDNLPQLLEELNPKERINVLLKFLPYTLPKTATIHYERDEPIDFNTL